MRGDGHVYSERWHASNELRILLAQTAAGPLLQEATDKMFAGVRAVANLAVSALNCGRSHGPPGTSHLGRSEGRVRD